ncbi:MAG: glycine betaine ABC transporter substrate-binding protein [Phycisphaerae bacterium]
MLKCLNMALLRRVPVGVGLLAVLAAKPCGAQAQPIRIGSKAFTESVILGEMLTQLARSSGAQAVHRQELGGTRVLFNALVSGDIDVYAEYTGTIRQELLAGRDLTGLESMRVALAQESIVASEKLGFNNTYILGMTPATASKLGIEVISDLKTHPELRFGFSNEFMDRGDGWPGLRRRYALPQTDVRGLQHDLAYRGLAAGDIDVIDLYSTDANIQHYNIKTLKDDLEYFPRYDAVILYRADLVDRAPRVLAALLELPGQIDDSRMIALNARTQIDRVPEPVVAADFLAEHLGVEVQADVETVAQRLARTTSEHLFLVVVSMTAAVLVAIPLGVWSAKKPRAGQVVLGLVGMIQTIPALALLVLLIGPLKQLGLSGLGTAPAVVALFLYSLLPIVRNTCTGLNEIPGHIRESAQALGLPPAARLRLVELPLASRTILAGIKTAVVINIGFATLGALIGAGGYGQPILTGIRLDRYDLIMQGALPAAGLALIAQGLFELADRLLVPKGLRLRADT